MPKFYFVRHGETVWNTKGIFQGRSNSNLTEKGIQQAVLLANRLENVPFHKIYSSPQKRSIETAKLLRKGKDLEINIIDEFQEISMGLVEGITREEFQKRYPQEFNDFWNNSKDYNPIAYNGETYFALLERVKNGLNKLIEENSSDDILVVTHGITLKAIFNLINNFDIENFSNQPTPENTSVTTVLYENDKLSILEFSDVSHLKLGSR